MSDEQKELIDSYLCELNRTGKFHSTSARQIAADLLEKHEAELINTATGNPYDERTIRKYIESFVDNWLSDGRAFTRGVTKKLMYAADQLADEAVKNPQAYKVLADKFAPLKHDERTDKPAVSPVVVGILQQPDMETTICIGQDALAARIGHQGHECLNPGDSVADGQQEIPAPKALPRGHDTPVRGVHDGEDTPQGSPVSDTPVSPEDPVDNDGGGDLDASE